MNILAAIGMCINSNLKKPLDITLNEIQTSINRKATRNVAEVLGVPYNATYNAQILTTADDPIFSVNGSGRILQIIPVTNSSSSDKFGTVLLTVDGNIVINNKVTYAMSASNYPGNYIVDTFLESGNGTIYTDIFSSGGLVYASRSASCRANVDTYSDKSTGIFNPNGIPFNNGFELRLSQSMGETSVVKTGVIVVYELDT